MTKELQHIDLKRVRELKNYLIFRGYAEDQKELAQKLDYTEGTFSSILSGKRDVTMKFLNKILELDENVNKSYILENTGDLLRNDISTENKRLMRENELLTELLEAKKEEILRLKSDIDVLKNVKD